MKISRKRYEAQQRAHAKELRKADHALTAAQFKTVNVKLKAASMAVKLEAKNNKLRLAGMNEWRLTVERLLDTRISQETHEALAARVKVAEDATRDRVGKSAGFSQFGAIIVTALTSASVAVGIFAAIMGVV